MSGAPSLRIDRWLFHARFVRRREWAATLLSERRVRLNGQLVCKTHQPVRPGDILTLSVGQRILVVRVLELGERRGPPAEARTLYEPLPDSDPFD